MVAQRKQLGLAGVAGVYLRSGEGGTLPGPKHGSGIHSAGGSQLGLLGLAYQSAAGQFQIGSFVFSRWPVSGPPIPALAWHHPEMPIKSRLAARASSPPHCSKAREGEGAGPPRRSTCNNQYISAGFSGSRICTYPGPRRAAWRSPSACAAGQAASTLHGTRGGHADHAVVVGHDHVTGRPACRRRRWGC
jgi:hypothetical protein